MRGAALLPALAFALLPLPGCRRAPAAPPADPPEQGPPAAPAAKRLDNGRLSLGRLIIDQSSRSVTAPAVLNMDRGPVEYLAVTGTGKLHESVLKVEERGLHLQLALILAGLEAGEPVSRLGDDRTPAGPPLRLEVYWKGAKSRLPAERLIREFESGRPMQKDAWRFTGSALREGILLADETGSLIAAYRDPAAIINNALPGGTDDTVYEANPQACPPAGTAVELTIRAADSAAR